MSYAQFVTERRLRRSASSPLAFLYQPGVPSLFAMSFSRADATTCATYVDAAGLVQTVAANVLRDGHYINGVRTTLREGAATNLVVQPEAITAANGWTIGVGVTVTAAYSTCGSVNLTRIQGANVSDIKRAVTLTGDGVKAYSQIVQFDGNAGTTVHVFYDSTAAAVRCAVGVTWAAGGTATCNVTTGVLLFFTRLADVGGMPTYQFGAATTSCTAASAHLVYPNWGGTATSYRTGAVQVEDAAACSSYIQNTTTTLTRAADLWSFPWSRSPEAGTFYVDAYDLMGAATGLTPTGFGISAATPYDTLYKNAGKWTNYLSAAAGTSISTAAAGAAYGDRVELRPFLTVTGANYDATLGQSINGAAEAVAAAGTAQAKDAAWGTASPVLAIGSTSIGTAPANLAIRSIAYVPIADYPLAAFRALMGG